MPAFNILIPTGIPEIDRQHNQLLECLNRLKSYTGTRHEFAATMEAVGALSDYVHYHFSYEESFLQAMDYPEFEDHQAKHRVLTDSMHALLREVEEDGEVTTQVQRTISDWIVNHINGEDPFYVVFRNQKVRGTNDLDACLERLANDLGVDIAYAMKAFDGNKEFYLRLLNMLVAQHRHDMERVLAALAENKRHEAEMIAHTLKGVSSSLWIPDLADAARRLCDHLGQPLGTDDHRLVNEVILEVKDHLHRLEVWMADCHGLTTAIPEAS